MKGASDKRSRDKEQSSYREIFKSTSLFGGVQVFNILIAVIRTKFIAVLLGPAGMGIAGLLTSTTSMVEVLTNFSLRTSAVKNVAAAHANGDSKQVATVVFTLRKWIWLTGILGLALTVVLAPWLSQLTFGNRDYTLIFVWLSVTLLMNQLRMGQMALLQGTRRLPQLAKSELLGSAVSLVIAIPLYYFFRFEGIAPAIILTAAVSLAVSWVFARNVPIEKVKLLPGVIFQEGKKMLTMGLALSLNGIIVIGVAYIIRIFISREGGLDQVGLYNAGFAIINSYVGMIFTAMGADYFPRLSGVAHSNELSRKLINQQAEIAILILAPILTVFLVFIQWVVILLYSRQFIAIDGMIHWATLGMFFKAASWSVAFIFLAKGETRLFFWSELGANSYILLINLIGYRLGGLEGIGIAFMVGYALYLIQVLIICLYKYQFSFQSEFYQLFCVQFLVALSCFLVVKLVSAPYSYLVGAPLILFSTALSYRELDKRMGIRAKIDNVIRRR
jgi:O-antigen/teichoic acid export membrane protein